MKNNILALIFTIGLIHWFTMFSNHTDNDELYLSWAEEEFSPESCNKSMELELLNLVNNYRIDSNFNSLQMCENATIEAKRLSDEIINLSEPNNIVYSEPTLDNSKQIKENIAVGFSNPREVLNNWLAQEEQKSILENNKFTNAGVSVKQIQDDFYVFTLVLYETNN